MKEYILNDGFYQHIVIQWEGKWYKIPSIVIRDVAEQDYNKSGKPFKDCPLSIWLVHFSTVSKYYGTEEANTIKEFKELFSEKMPQMEAYLLYKETVE